MGGVGFFVLCVASFYEGMGGFYEGMIGFVRLYLFL